LWKNQCDRSTDRRGCTGPCAPPNVSGKGVGACRARTPRLSPARGPCGAASLVKLGQRPTPPNPQTVDSSLWRRNEQAKRRRRNACATRPGA